MKRILARLGVMITGVAAALAIVALMGSASAQSGLLGQEKTIVPLIKPSWISFRNYNGRQLIYFTMLQTYRCGLREIRYSLNSEDLDRRFALPPCDPQRPNAIDAEKYPPYISLPMGAVQSAAVQVTFADGSASAVARFTPCDTPGDSACAVLR
ncbi:MAG: hypothetical protein ACC631_12080 [Halocynthiibacter sp.]